MRYIYKTYRKIVSQVSNLWDDLAAWDDGEQWTD
jgi:hypothetical protein